MDLTIEPWLEGFWPVLKETLAKLNLPTESLVNDLSTSIQQLNLTTETKPCVERQISSSNRFKSDQDSVTYSAALAELTSLTLPPKPTHSLAINLVESSEVTSFTFYPMTINNDRFCRRQHRMRLPTIIVQYYRIESA